MIAINKQQITRVQFKKTRLSNTEIRYKKPWVFFGTPVKRYFYDYMEVNLDEHQFEKNGFIYWKPLVVVETSGGHTNSVWFNTDEDAESFFKDKTKDSNYLVFDKE